MAASLSAHGLQDPGLAWAGERRPAEPIRPRAHRHPAQSGGTAALLFDAPARGLSALIGGLDGRVLFAAAFTGLLATAATFGIQTVAQRFTTATHTALIFAAEPVFARLFSFLLIGEVLGPRQLIGCGLILAGMVVAEMRRGGETWCVMRDMSVLYNLEPATAASRPHRSSTSD